MKRAPRLDLTDAQLAAIRERFHDTAAKTGAGESFWTLFPQMRAALDALPDTAEIVRCQPAVRAVFRDAVCTVGGEWPSALSVYLRLPPR